MSKDLHISFRIRRKVLEKVRKIAPSQLRSCANYIELAIEEKIKRDKSLKEQGYHRCVRGV